MNQIKWMSVIAAAMLTAMAGTRTPQTRAAAPASPHGVGIGSAFTYRGELRRDGNAYSGACDLQFSLWDAPASGAQLGSTQVITSVSVTRGQFNVQLNEAGQFGSSAFTGEARWLEVAVQCLGDPGFTTLAPRTAMGAVPFAQSLRPGAIVVNPASSSLAIVAGESEGIAAQSITSDGISGYGGAGHAGASGFNTNTNSVGVYGVANQTGSIGVSGYGANAGVFGQSANGSAIRAQSTGGSGLVVDSAGYIGVDILSAGFEGLRVYSATVAGVDATAAQVGVLGSGGPGFSGVLGTNTNANSIGVKGVANSSGSVGVWGQSTANTGVYGVSANGNGVWGASDNAVGVRGESAADTGVFGVSTLGRGVWGQSANTAGVFGDGGSSAGGVGVYGRNVNNSTIGVKGEAQGFGAVGVWGESAANTGVYGLTTSGRAIYGQVSNGGSGQAGYFQGNVQVTGSLSKGAGSFKIDHPLDPTNQYLYHSFVESPDMLNIYNGNITTDANGFAVVELPDWFEALNKDFRYQLTVVGQFAQAIVAKEIERNAFTIQTDKPKVKVSWQVTGIRKDPYANAHRIPVEEVKPAGEQGTYLHPDAYGVPASMGVNYEQNQALARMVTPAEPGVRPPVGNTGAALDRVP